MSLHLGAQHAYDAEAGDLDCDLAGMVSDLNTDTALLEALMARGYEPEDNLCEEIVSALYRPHGTVRVVVTADGAAVHALSPREVCQWSARFDATTPAAVVLAAMDTAEREIA